MNFMLARRHYVFFMRALSQNLTEQSAVIASLYEASAPVEPKPLAPAKATDDKVGSDDEDQPGAAAAVRLHVEYFDCFFVGISVVPISVPVSLHLLTSKYSPCAILKNSCNH